MTIAPRAARKGRAPLWVDITLRGVITPIFNLRHYQRKARLPVPAPSALIRQQSTDTTRTRALLDREIADQQHPIPGRDRPACSRRACRRPSRTDPEFVAAALGQPVEDDFQWVKLVRLNDG